MAADKSEAVSEVPNVARIRPSIRPARRPPLANKIGERLVGRGSEDTLHNAACMLEYLREIGVASHGGQLTEDDLYGRWLIDSAIVAMLRHGIAQAREEQAELRA